MLFGLTDTGKRNSDFATAFLRAEDIPLTASSIGGDQARQIRMNPGNGRVRLRFVPKERAIPLQDKLPPCANGVELL